jgi:DNA polymerase family B
VKSSVREGVLPRMLEEILETRLMVKQSMKLYKENNALQRVLHSRQLGLKLIANVTLVNYHLTLIFSYRLLNLLCSNIGMVTQQLISVVECRV